MKLLYFFQPGCRTCEKTKPAVAAFKKAHPEIPVVSVDLTETEWNESIEPPPATPSFAVIRPGRPPRTLTGETLIEMLGRPPTLQDLERWVLAGG